MKSIPNQDEQGLASYYIYNPAAERLPLSNFADPKARSVLETLSAMEAEGIEVSSVTFPAAACKMERLACEPGELAADVVMSEASTWTPVIAESATRTVKKASEHRNLHRDLRDALKRLEADEPIDAVIASLQNHHQLSSGSLGSFDTEPSETPIPFPLAALGMIPGAFSEETARVAMVPDSLAGASVLGILSVAIGAALRVENYRGSTGANLFILPIASSGTGKDSALNLAAEPLNEIDDETNDRWKSETKPDLLAELRMVNADIKALERADRGQSDENTLQSRDESRRLECRRLEIESQLEAEPSLMVGDITKEALAVAIAAQRHEALGVVSSEARGILQVIGGRYSSGSDEDLYTAGFSGTRTKVNRLSRPPVVLKNPCLAMLLMVQPDAFQKLSENDAMTESGYLPRNLLFDSKAEPLDVALGAKPFYELLRQRWHELINDLVAMRELEPGIVIPEKEALELLREYDNETRARRRKGGDLKDVGAYAARWPEIAWRIALVIHAAEHRGNSVNVPLSKLTASNAIKIIRWFALESLNLLEATRETRIRKRVDRLRELLAGAENNRMAIRDLAKSHGFEIEELKSIGKRASWLQFGEIQNPKGGPRSHVAFINPEKA
jgi:hypothetical protein